MRRLQCLYIVIVCGAGGAVGTAYGLAMPRQTSRGKAGWSGTFDKVATRIPTGGGTAPLKSSADSTSISSTESDSDAKTTLSAATFNLIKACVGSGVLALPAGVAAMGDVPAALLPASIMVAGLGAFSAYSFFLLGRLNSVSEKKATSLGDAWKNEVGESSSWLVTLSCLLTPLGAALAYSIMLGDMLSSLAQTAGVKGVMATRQASILAITMGLLYPLCNLKSLAALAPVSMVGVAGIFITCIFMAMRAASGAYAPGGIYFDTIAESLQPSFGVIGMSKAFSPSILVLGGMAATSYLVHFSAHDFHNGLKDNTMRRFGLLVGMGFAGTATINVLIMCFGFLTFGGNSAGLILNNYSTLDAGATLCRLVTVISLIGSYPIFFRGIKSSFFELMYHGKEISEELNKKVANIILASLTGLSMILKNAGFMVGLTGAIMGSAIIYIFPPVLFLKSSSRRIQSGQLAETKRVKFERALSRFFIALGAVVGVVGGVVTVLDSFFPGVL